MIKIWIKIFRLSGRIWNAFQSENKNLNQLLNSSKGLNLLINKLATIKV